MDELSNFENNVNMSSSEDTISDESESITENTGEDTGAQDTNSAICINKDILTKTHNVLWDDFAIPYSGMPFIIVSSKVLDCHHGFDRNISVKKNYQVKKQKTNMDDHCFQKNYVVLQDTKKFMCPAKINMREILQFPDFKISERSVWRQNKASKMLREKLKTSSLNEIFHIRIIVVAIDDVSCHDKHLFGPAELIAQSIDPLISKKIEEYVMEGVFNVREMKRLLRIAVNDIFEKANLPPPNNRRFFPRVDTIRSHIVKIKQKLRQKCKSFIFL
ncbi:calcium-responsive transcription factor-like isoform X2 [Hydra vulgaris]|uniref:Calcium-responsive transcription factor-like isoform X2 n=1 Tax=Hydra vulgaris TaxID=6087 RepID=A0ABM4C763_HYDVU